MIRFLSLALILLSAHVLYADIPRLDIVKVNYQNENYYFGATIEHLEFREGCVFDKYTKDYLYEQSSFFKEYFGSGYILLYKDLLSIPNSKFSQSLVRLIKREDDSDQLHFLLNKKEKILGSSLDSLIYVDRIKGNTAGMTFTNTLSLNDKEWLMDYPLSSIISMTDGEICNLELFAIKGNIHATEVKKIKSKLKKLYHSSRNVENYEGITVDAYYAQLLEQHILMVGFCSC